MKTKPLNRGKQKRGYITREKLILLKHDGLVNLTELGRRAGMSSQVVNRYASFRYPTLRIERKRAENEAMRQALLWLHRWLTQVLNHPYPFRRHRLTELHLTKLIHLHEIGRRMGLKSERWYRYYSENHGIERIEDKPELTKKLMAEFKGLHQTLEHILCLD